MNQNELRELDAWIAEHVMGWKFDPDFGWFDNDGNPDFEPTPTTDPAAAMEVLKKCNLEVSRRHALEPRTPYVINMGYATQLKEHWFNWHSGIGGQAATPELAICLFAKKLFTKE